MAVKRKKPRKPRMNTNCLAGMKCPVCDSLGPFTICTSCMAEVHDDGIEETQDHEWDLDNTCHCRECGLGADVRTFTIGNPAYKHYRMRDPRYICAACAEERGAVWPKGHCATQHTGTCKYCGRAKGLCALDDWRWPKCSHRPKGPGGGRD
jgi:hypothetical protein